MSPEERNELCRNQIAQTREDRESIISAYSTDAEVNEQCLSALTRQIDDPDSLQLRYARLYASLSVSIEPYDNTRQLTLEMIDSFLSKLAVTACLQLKPQEGSDFVKCLVSARNSGLNPQKRTDQNPLEAC
jgi:hypothetical protein